MAITEHSYLLTDSFVFGIEKLDRCVKRCVHIILVLFRTVLMRPVLLPKHRIGFHLSVFVCTTVFELTFLFHP